jgi:hypothetical protein
MGPKRKLILPIKFSEICIVLNRTNDFDLRFVAALSANKHEEWNVLTREQLKHAKCEFPERFIAPYILLYYVISKYKLDLSQPLRLIDAAKEQKLYTDVISYYKKLGSNKNPQRWSQVVPKELLPPMRPFLYQFLEGNEVLVPFPVTEFRA